MIYFNSNQKSSTKIVSSYNEWLITEDQNRVFDTWLGAGTLMFGHKMDSVNLEMLPYGMPVNTSIENAFGELVDFEVGGIGFQTSGSSAVTRAIRLARSLTNREKIAVVGRFWHGSDNEFLFKNNKEQLSYGVPISCQSEVDWFDSINEFISSSKIDLFAAIIVEPHQGADPSVSILDSITKENRDSLKSAGVLLVCDEIITGFRERFGSSSSSREAAPDIVIFGKTLALGFPVGMVLVNKDALSTEERYPFWGGTFASSPSQLYRVCESLKKLKGLDYKKIEVNHEDLIDFISDTVDRFDYEIKTGCMFSRLSKKMMLTSAREFISKSSCFVEMQNELLKKGVFLADNALIFPSVYNIHKSIIGEG